MYYPSSPIIKKFFSNKIESSTKEWGDYLLEIADIFSRFDGEEYNRELLTEEFQTISGRSPYTVRDAANFRDEFGAYGAYLGLFQIKQIDGKWRLLLSEATKHLLCSPEPNVEAFCILQLSMFQYPNGLGFVPIQNRIQNNIFLDTIREISSQARLNPLRLLCKLVNALYLYKHIDFDNISIPYKLIFLLFNSPIVNRSYSPAYENILQVVDNYFEGVNLPSWLYEERYLINFKRNFHIFERTGIFLRKKDGLYIAEYNYDKVYKYIKTIDAMEYNFQGFENCYQKDDIEDCIRNVIYNGTWGNYYDALSLPMHIINNMEDNIETDEIILWDSNKKSITLKEEEFPDFRKFISSEPRAFSPINNYNDPLEALILREKANREHARILTMLAALLRASGHEPYENIFIDLFVESDNKSIIFEVKSNTIKNTLAQVRKAIAQLYEYRYKSKQQDAFLCLILQQEPLQSWIVDYLIHDRKILMGWLVDNVRLECPWECQSVLSEFGVISQ